MATFSSLLLSKTVEHVSWQIGFTRLLTISNSPSIIEEDGRTFINRDSATLVEKSTYPDLFKHLERSSAVLIGTTSTVLPRLVDRSKPTIPTTFLGTQVRSNEALYTRVK